MKTFDELWSELSEKARSRPDGSGTVAQLDANLAAADLVLEARHVEALDKASAFDLGYPYAFIGMTQSSW